MDRKTLECLREWVQAEVISGIADAQEDESGYTRIGRAERKDAERLWKELTDLAEE